MRHRNTRPVLPGFHSDPTICYVDGRWYLAVSSFEYFPAAPVFTSTDLVRWDRVGHVVDRPEQIDYSGVPDSLGLYGSTLRWHDGRFWFVTTDVTRLERGQLLFTASDPAGPWSDPVRIPDAVGIDPDIAWDDDGVALLTWASLRPDGQTEISQADVDTRSGAFTSSVRTLWSGTGMRNPEGPHLYRIGDWWYLLVAEGGTDRGHSVSVARSRHPRGEFSGNPANPVLTHRSTNHPVQSVGHADLVPGPVGTWVMTFHGTRPSGQFPEFHVLGRETFLADVTFDSDGWPVVREVDRTTAEPPAIVETFTGPLASHWVTPGASALPALPTERGLVLDGGRPLVTRVQHEEWSATAEFADRDGAGRLVLRIDDRHWYAVEARSATLTATVCIGGLVNHLESVHVPRGQSATAAIRVTRPSGDAVVNMKDGPDLVELGFVDADGDFVVLAGLDGRYVSTEVAGGFTGRMVGLAHVSGSVTVRGFTVHSLSDTPAERALAGVGDVASRA